MPGCDTQRHERGLEIELVRGCMAGDPAAWRRFEQVFSPSLQAGAARVCSAAEFVAEVVQELRVSLFAQELRTPFPVSAKRLQKFWDEHLR